MIHFVNFNLFWAHEFTLELDDQMAGQVKKVPIQS